MLFRSPKDDYQAQDDALQSTLSIVWDILKRIYNAALADEFNFDLAAAVVEPISTWMADDNYGWRVQLEIEALWPNCPTENFTND